MNLTAESFEFKKAAQYFNEILRRIRIILPQYEGFDAYTEHFGEIY
jgi:hypothetical protein